MNFVSLHNIDLILRTWLCENTCIVIFATKLQEKKRKFALEKHNG